jgi:DNA-binding transcriptional ArsR family regulator
MEKQLDLVLHPIRMRIIMAMAGRQMTAQQVAEALGDVPPATLYRHINRLAKAGLLAVVEERRVRGTVEKVYALKAQDPNAVTKELSKASRDEHLHYFTTFIATLLDDYSRYLKKPGRIDLAADGVGYHKLPLELTDQEFAAMAAGINAAIIPYLKNEHAPDRKRRIFVTVVMPDVQMTTVRESHQRNKIKEIE